MSADQPTFLLVDGNNIIHAWDDLLALHRKRNGLAHAELVRWLQDYQSFTGERVVVVFDGRGTRITEQRDGVQIFYTDGGTTADSVIERLAAKYASQYRIIAATDDVPEQNMVIAAGGEVISSFSLRNQLEIADSEQTRFLSQRRKKSL